MWDVLHRTMAEQTYETSIHADGYGSSIRHTIYRNGVLLYGDFLAAKEQNQNTLKASSSAFHGLGAIHDHVPSKHKWR